MRFGTQWPRCGPHGTRGASTVGRMLHAGWRKWQRRLAADCGACGGGPVPVHSRSWLRDWGLAGFPVPDGLRGLPEERPEVEGDCWGHPISGETPLPLSISGDTPLPLSISGETPLPLWQGLLARGAGRTGMRPSSPRGLAFGAPRSKKRAKKRGRTLDGSHRQLLSP